MMAGAGGLQRWRTGYSPFIISILWSFALLISSDPNAKTWSFPLHSHPYSSRQCRSSTSRPTLTFQNDVPSSTITKSHQSSWEYRLQASPSGDNDEENDEGSIMQSVVDLVQSNPTRSFLFSIAMTGAGAVLGPFLDAYHSAFGVLQYDDPFKAILWGSAEYPGLTTVWWVPVLFGLAGFIIGWMYVILDQGIMNVIESSSSSIKQPSAPKILIGISFFTLQYWLSGILYSSGMDRTLILNIMSLLAAIGFTFLDGSFTGFITSSATAIGGPLIETGLILLTQLGLIQGGYHYTDLGETGFFPLWIVPVYFLGGPAVGNLARGIWNQQLYLSPEEESNNIINVIKEPPGCTICNDSRAIPCPNCDGVGQYVAMGNRMVTCTACKGRGLVICRACFQYYDDDPYDIEAIRQRMSRMPD
eukprot:CAMPEP_0198143690 /NCGR_PEP_ID=MMETSP1443-20131203/9474_1 /TAXON_ID=186043 /ORGANISM="Entomoneis sp., Strain CCMP2396" /LENGTH=416 /DNA_ID=CAMNT_0043806965 /DNA_START=16 /DNA_END=1266 /DNA_ORIENTATION=-